MENENYREYIELSRKISDLTDIKKEVAIKIMSEMEDRGTNVIKGNLGTISMVERTSYKYTENVDKINNELKELKKVEETTGVAEKKVSKYIKVINKIK